MDFDFCFLEPAGRDVDLPEPHTSLAQTVGHCDVARGASDQGLGEPSCLLELAAFLASNPAVPLPNCGELTYCVMEDDDNAGIAEVASVAAALDVPVTGSPMRPNASRSFGPLAYRAFYVPRHDMAQWRALVSYDGAVEVAP